MLSHCYRNAMVVLSLHFRGMDVRKPQRQYAKHRQMLVNSESRKGDRDVASLIAAEGLQCGKLIACDLRNRVLAVRSLAGVLSGSQYQYHSVTVTVSVSQCHSLSISIAVSQYQCHGVTVTVLVSQCHCHSIINKVSLSQYQYHTIWSAQRVKT